MTTPHRSKSVETSTALQHFVEQHFQKSSNMLLRRDSISILWGNVPYYIPVLETDVAHRKASEELCRRCLFNLNRMFCKLAC